jgi:hypothetical protein
MIKAVTIDCSPGRQVVHVWTTDQGGRPVPHRWPYEIVGLAYDVRGQCWRVVLRDLSDDADTAGLLRIFTLDTFSRSFVPAEVPTPVPEAAPAGAPPEKVAGAHQQGSGV